MGLGAAIPFIKGLAPKPIDPADVDSAVAAYLEEHPEATCPIDDTAGEGDTGKVWSADKTAGEVATLTEAIVPVEGFMTTNDFDAGDSGKTNLLATPYQISNILTGKQITSNGSIGDKSSACVSPLVPVSQGTYGIKTANGAASVGQISSGNSYKNGYGFFAADGETVVSRPESLLHSISDNIFVFDVPQDAKYVRFCYIAQSSQYYEAALEYFNQWILLPNANDDIDDSFFDLGSAKQNGEIDRIKRTDGSYLKIKDAEAWKIGDRTCAIFKKACFIGDSFTAGYIYNSSGEAHTDNDYSWVEHLKKMTGRDYVNCGVSGATTKTWLTNADGLAKAQVAANKAQAYMIGLQINDAAAEMTVGTTADIGTQADSYIGYTSQIIDAVFTINADAHVFLLTQPKNFTGAHTPYRQAILDIVEWYQTNGNGTHQTQVHLIDLLDYWELFRNDGCLNTMANGHYTAVGWEYVAEIMAKAWSHYLNEHPLLFQDVNLIPYGTAT